MTYFDDFETNKKKKEYTDKIYVMIYAMHTLQYKGISLEKTLSSVLQYYTDWYQQTPDRRFLDLIELHLQSYVDMGYALDSRVTVIDRALQLLNRTADQFHPSGCFFGKAVRLNRTQIRSIIGKWKPSKHNPMTIQEVISDIIQKVSGNQYGRYIYQYHRSSDKEAQIPDTYELVVTQERSYFHDVNNFKFYTFLDDKKKQGEVLI